MRNMIFSCRFFVWFKVLLIKLKNTKKNVQTRKWCNVGQKTVLASVHHAFYSTARQSGFTFVNETKFKENNSKVVIGNDV